MLIVSFKLLLSQYMTLPEFVRGALTGLGIGMEIIGLTRLITFRQKYAVLLKINNYAIAKV